jgi:hypothetical protein
MYRGENRKPLSLAIPFSTAFLLSFPSHSSMSSFLLLLLLLRASHEPCALLLTPFFLHTLTGASVVQHFTALSNTTACMHHKVCARQTGSEVDRERERLRKLKRYGGVVDAVHNHFWLSALDSY